MRIALLGNFLVSYCSEAQYALELEHLGHTVDRLQENTVAPHDCLQVALKSDLFIWVHTHNWSTLGMLEVLRQLKEVGIPTVGYHLDLYMGIQRWQEYAKHEYLNGLDYFFTVDKLMADWINAHTKSKGIYLPAGVFSKEVICRDLPKTHSVVFTGSRKYHAEWAYRPQLIDWLDRTYRERFEHYGNDGIRVIRGDELNNLYASTRVVIGDTLCPNFDYPYYFSDRVFEVIGRGGFIIHPYIKGIEDCFDLETELVTYKYGDFDELKAKIDYYLANDLAREKIKRAGFDRVKKEHTYKHRWETIIGTVCKK